MVEEIIDPRDTRPLLCEFADWRRPYVHRAAPPSAIGRKRRADVSHHRLTGHPYTDLICAATGAAAASASCTAPMARVTAACVGSMTGTPRSAAKAAR